MTFQEAIIEAVDELGRSLFSNHQIANILDDFHAYDECRAFKFIVNGIMELGYFSKIRQIVDWSKDGEILLNKCIQETGFQESKLEYIFHSSAYALKIRKEKGVYNNDLDKHNRITVRSKSTSSKGITKPSSQSSSTNVTNGLNSTTKFAPIDKNTITDYLDSVLTIDRCVFNLGSNVSIKSEYMSLTYGDFIKFKVMVEYPAIKYNSRVIFKISIFNTAGKAIEEKTCVIDNFGKLKVQSETSLIDLSDLGNIRDITKIFVSCKRI